MKTSEIKKGYLKELIGTHPLKSNHNNLNNPQIGVRILLKSNLEYTDLIEVSRRKILLIKTNLEGAKRQFDDLGILHCSSTHGLVGLVLAAIQ